MHGFMNFNLYRPKKVFGFVVPWEGSISLTHLINECDFLMIENFIFQSFLTNDFEVDPSGLSYAQRVIEHNFEPEASAFQ